MRTAIDADQLVARVSKLITSWRPEASLRSLETLMGGESGLTYVASLAGATEDRLVIKVAPPGMRPIQNHDVLRQAGLLRWLERDPMIPVPLVEFVDEGSPPEVPPLFAMRYCQGECVEPHFDGLSPSTSDKSMEGRAMQAVQLMAALHRIDQQRLALAAEPRSLSDEIDRWAKVLRKYGPKNLERYEVCEQLLRSSEPASVPASLVHGDFRLGNLLCRGADVIAVIDWEIWGLGDPRTDLAWFLMNCDPRVNHLPSIERKGIPSEEVLLRHYEASGGLAFADLNWFRALELFKSAAIWTLIARDKQDHLDARYQCVVNLLPLQMDAAIAALH